MSTTALPTAASTTVHRPATVAEAQSMIADGAVPLAGATWVMRVGGAGSTYVALSGLPGLRAIVPGTDGVVLGGLCTHTDLAAAGLPPSAGAVRTAAAESAFPQIRNVATLGGNLGAVGFAEADLVPALLATDARLEIAGGTARVDPAEFLAARPPGALITGVVLPVGEEWRSGYARHTVRGGGEYAIASVALAVRRGAGGAVADARVALGSVEALARRCPEAEAALVGAPLTPDAARSAGAAAAAAVTPRDGTDAPGWYRAAVLPALFERAARRALPEEM